MQHAEIEIRYAVRGSVIHTCLDTESVLLDLDSGRYFSLSGVGSRIWTQLAKEPRTIEELLAGLLQEYDVSRERAEGDVRELLEALVQYGLVELADR